MPRPPRLLWLDRLPERCPEDDEPVERREAELRIEFPDDALELRLELARCPRDGTWIAPYPLLRQVARTYGLDLEDALELSLGGEALRVEVWAGSTVGAVRWDEGGAPFDEEPELPTPEALGRLPAMREAWSLAHGPAGMFLDDEARPVRSYVGMVADARGAVRRFMLYEAAPDMEALAALALRACASPKPGFAPARPRVLHVDDQALAADLGAELDEAGLRVAVGDATPALEALAVLQEALDPEPVPAYFARYDEAEVAAFFRAAAAFFRAEPWEVFDGRKFLAFRLEEGPWRYATVMGQEGEEFGLAMFGDWLEVCRTASDPGPSLDLLALLEGREPEVTDPLETIGAAESLTLGEPEQLADEDAELLRRLRISPSWRGEYALVYRFTPDGLEPPAFEPAIYAGLMEVVAERARKVRGAAVSSVTARVATPRGELRVRYPAKGDEGSSRSGYYRFVVPFARWTRSPAERKPLLRVVVEAPGEVKWHRVMNQVLRAVRGREGIVPWIRGVTHGGHYVWSKRSPLPAISPTVEMLAALAGPELEGPEGGAALLEFEPITRPADAQIRVRIDEA